MDFESCCSDCCENCYLTNQKLDSEVVGQGDCECNKEVLLEQSYRTNLDKTEQLAEKDFWNKEKLEKKNEMQNSSVEKRCTCCKNSQEPQGKTKTEGNQEKCHSDILDSFDNNLYHLLAEEWTQNKAFRSEKSNSRNCSPDRFLRSNCLHLEGKVNYLLQSLKDYCHKISGEKPFEQSHVKFSGAIYEEIYHLLNLNRRMCAAEDGIEKLTWILQELLNQFRKRPENSVASEDQTSNILWDLDETNLEQKIKSMLHRNDFLGKFMRAFLKVGLKESKITKDEKLKQTLGSSLHNPGKCKPAEAKTNQKDETNIVHKHKSDQKPSKKLKNQALSENKNLKKIEEKVENDRKSSGNKLEVISEVGEYAITPKLEKEISELSKKLGVKNLKEFIINERGEDEGILEIKTVPTSIIKDSFQNLSIEKCDSDLFSKSEPSKKNCLKIKLNQINDIKGTEENFDVFGTEINLGILSISPQNSGNELKSNKVLSLVSTKHSKLQEPKLGKKDLKCTSKTSSKLCKKMEEKNESKKNKLSPKTVNKCSSTIGAPNQKSGCTHNGYQGIPKKVPIFIQRPMTAPHAERKPLPPASLSKSSSKNFLKSSVQSESTKKSISVNVKNKNKNLQNKKSFVRTS